MKRMLADVCPELINEWSQRNLPITPDSVTHGSNKIVWWKGKCGHEWRASVKNRVIGGSGCPYCSHNAILEGFASMTSLLKSLILPQSGLIEMPLYSLHKLLFSQTARLGGNAESAVMNGKHSFLLVQTEVNVRIVAVIYYSKGLMIWLRNIRSLRRNGQTETYHLLLIR